MTDDTVWRALADPTRRSLLDRLRDGPSTTGALAAGLPVTRFAVMKHLDILVAAGLVLVERRGRERLNYLNPVPLRRVHERWLAPHASRAPTRTPNDTPPGEDMTDPRPASAVVTDAFDVRRERLLTTPRQTVFTAVLDIAAWWPHRAREDSYLALEPHVGGRFYESWRTGGVLLGTVVGIVDDQHLALSGPMTIDGAVVSTWSLDLADVTGGDGATDGRTVLTLRHQAVGWIGADARRRSDEGWDAVLDALTGHLERDDGRGSLGFSEGHCR